MIYLSLDQAARVTGWAVFDNKTLKEYGTFSIKSSLPMEQRLAQFWQELNELKNKFEPNYIFFEDIQNQHNNETYKKLAYIQAAIILWCYFNDIKFSVLAPSHWRKIIKESAEHPLVKSEKNKKKLLFNL